MDECIRPKQVVYPSAVTPIKQVWSGINLYKFDMHNTVYIENYIMRGLCEVQV